MTGQIFPNIYIKENTFDLTFVHFATMIIHYFNVDYCLFEETKQYHAPLFRDKIANLYFKILFDPFSSGCVI